MHDSTHSIPSVNETAENDKRRYLFRLVLPAFPPFNIYSRIAKTTTALGPVCVATAAAKLPNWDVEVIDENNCRSPFCPKDKAGLPDHVELQKLRPADVVGFYGSMTSAIPRLYQLAEHYHEQGVKTIVGGYHVRSLPKEALDNFLDVVAMGESETIVRDILSAFERDEEPLNIPGIYFNQNGTHIRNQDMAPIEDLDSLPFPDFNLVRYARLDIYPVGRTRGCNMNCEFCAVKDKSRCASPEWMVAQIAHLVETRKAREFFDVSDHFCASGVEESIRFCRLLAEYLKKTDVRIEMTVQIRLTDARHEELLSAMRDAGIYNLAIGIESCIDEELMVMRKGYHEKDIIELLDTYHKFGFFVHGMMIFGYPAKPENRIEISLRQRLNSFKVFIKHLDTAQILLPVPLPGTELTNRLKNEGRLFHLGYEYYDGQFLLFEPDEGIDAGELQHSVITLMSGFYRPGYLLRLINAVLILFPTIIFPRVATLFTFRVRYIVQGFRFWYHKHFRNNAIRFGGSFLVRKWKSYFRQSDFMSQLNQAREALHHDSENQNDSYSQKEHG